MRHEAGTAKIIFPDKNRFTAHVQSRISKMKKGYKRVFDYDSDKFYQTRGLRKMSQQQKRKDPFSMDERDDDSRSAVVNSGENNNYTKRGRAGSSLNVEIPAWQHGQSFSTSSRPRNNSTSNIVNVTAAGYQTAEMARITKQNELIGKKMALMNRLNSLGPNQEQQKFQITSQIETIDKDLSSLSTGLQA